jgi:hypothetical protein
MTIARSRASHGPLSSNHLPPRSGTFGRGCFRPTRNWAAVRSHGKSNSILIPRFAISGPCSLANCLHEILGSPRPCGNGNGNSSGLAHALRQTLLGPHPSNDKPRISILWAKAMGLGAIVSFSQPAVQRKQKTRGPCTKRKPTIVLWLPWGSVHCPSRSIASVCYSEKQ